MGGKKLIIHSIPDCFGCGCHSNLSDSMLCDNITGVGSCKPHIIGGYLWPGYY